MQQFKKAKAESTLGQQDGARDIDDLVDQLLQAIAEAGGRVLHAGDALGEDRLPEGARPALQTQERHDRETHANRASVGLLKAGTHDRISS